MNASNYIAERLIKGPLFSKRHVKKELVPQKCFLDDWFRNQGKSDSWHYYMSRHVQWLHHQNLPSKKFSAESKWKNPLNRYALSTLIFTVYKNEFRIKILHAAYHMSHMHFFWMTQINKQTFRAFQQKCICHHMKNNSHAFWAFCGISWVPSIR